MGLRGRTQLLSERCFFVTTSVVNHAPVFRSDDYCGILIRNIKHYRERYKFGVLGYVIMPSHFDWIVEVDQETGTVSDFMRDIKKYCAWDVLELLKDESQRDMISMFSEAARGYPRQRMKFWEDRFDDEVIRNDAMLRTKLEYIHNNPVKAGLVARPVEYRFSSARDYTFGDHSILEVKTDWF